MKTIKLLRFYNIISLLAIIILIISCSKYSDNQEINDKTLLDQLRLPEISNFTVNTKKSPDVNTTPVKNLSNKIANTTPPPNNPFKPIASTYKDGPGIIVSGAIDHNKLYFYQKYRSQMFTISDQSMALNIYPGAILRGQSIEGNFSPQLLTGISNNIRPITISTSMPVSGSAVARTSLPRPISERTLLNTALTDLENSNPGEIGAASLIVEMDTFRVYEELKTLYGYNNGINAFLINSNTIQQGENHLITSTSAIKIKFFQHNFTIDMDIPQNNNELFDPQGLDLNAITGGVTPVYVKNVTYGRMGIMTIESSYSSSKLYNAVYKQLGLLKNLIGIGSALTDEEKNIINTANIKVKYTGIGTDVSPAVAVSGLNGFIEVLNANKTYSKENPGIPIAFQLAYLNSSNSLVEAPFQINYGPFDKPYVRIEYKNSAWETNSPRNPRYTDSDIYMSFYQDPAALRPYQDAPIFITYKYEVSSGSKNTTNWMGNWNTSKHTNDLIFKNPKANQLIERKRVFYYVEYGNPSSTSRNYSQYDMVTSDNYHILQKTVDHYEASRTTENF